LNVENISLLRTTVASDLTAFDFIWCPVIEDLLYCCTWQSVYSKETYQLFWKYSSGNHTPASRLYSDPVILEQTLSPSCTQALFKGCPVYSSFQITHMQCDDHACSSWVSNGDQKEDKKYITASWELYCQWKLKWVLEQWWSTGR